MVLQRKDLKQGGIRPTGQLFQIFGAEVKPVPIGTTGIVGTDIFETEQAGLKALEERTKQEGVLEGADQTSASKLREIQRQGKLDIGLTRSQQAQELIKDIEARNRALQAQQRTSRLAGLEARTATGIGATPSTGAGIVAVSKDVSAQRLAILDRQRKLQSLQRESTQRRFEEATKEAKVESAKVLQAELKAIDKAVAGITEETAFIEQSRTDADKVIQTLIDTEGALANLTDQALENLAQGSTLPLAAILSLRQLDKDRQEANQIKDSVDRLAKLSEIASRESRILNESKTASQKDIEFLQLLEEEGADQSVIDAFKVRAGITAKPETALEREKRLKSEQERKVISQQTSPTSGARSINIGAVGTGSILPLGAIAPTGLMTRADKHNNPIALIADKVTIQRLTDAGLVQGEDFDIGETTDFPGTDISGAATVMFKDADTGVRGAIATMNSGFIGSWYANPNYGGSGRVISMLSELSGKEVNQSNAQSAFNGLSTPDKIEIVKAAYAFEGGTQLFSGEEVTTFRKDLLPLYAKFNNGKLTKDERVGLKDQGLTYKEFTKQALASKSTTDAEGSNFATDIISLAKELKNIEGRFGASIFALPRTDAATFESKFDNFQAKLSLQNLVDLKNQGATFGALSDNELNFITNAATSLRLGLPDEAWQAELDSIIEKMTKAIPEGQRTKPTISQQIQQTSNSEVAALDAEEAEILRLLNQ